MHNIELEASLWGELIENFSVGEYWRILQLQQFEVLQTTLQLREQT
jgi:hypothetical protein